MMEISRKDAKTQSLEVSRECETCLLPWLNSQVASVAEEPRRRVASVAASATEVTKSQEASKTICTARNFLSLCAPVYRRATAIIEARQRQLMELPDNS